MVLKLYTPEFKHSKRMKCRSRCEITFTLTYVCTMYLAFHYTDTVQCVVRRTSHIALGFILSNAPILFFFDFSVYSLFFYYFFFIFLISFHTLPLVPRAIDFIWKTTPFSALLPILQLYEDIISVSTSKMELKKWRIYIWNKCSLARALAFSRYFLIAEYDEEKRQ